MVPRCPIWCAKPRRVLARFALICREAVGGRRLAEVWRKLKDVYALRRISLREKDFGPKTKVLSKSIPDRIRTCNLRLRRPTRYPMTTRSGEARWRQNISSSRQRSGRHSECPHAGRSLAQPMAQRPWRDPKNMSSPRIQGLSNSIASEWFLHPYHIKGPASEDGVARGIECALVNSGACMQPI